MLGFAWCNAWIILFLLSYGEKEVWNEVCNLVDIWIEQKKKKKKERKQNTLDFIVNHHRAEISLIWLVKRSAIELLVLHVTGGKKTLKSREISILTLNW